MKNLFNNRKIANHSLMVAGVLLLISIFTFIPKITGMGFLLFIACIVWNTMMRFKSTSFSEAANYLGDHQNELKSKKKWFQFSVYMSVLPAIMIGMLVVVIMVGSYFFR